MKDIIIGRVTNVMDLHTVNIEVTRIVRNNNNTYNPIENVRFNTLQRELQPLRKIKNIRFVELLLKGKGVMCLINGRDDHGCIEADVYPLGYSKRSQKIQEINK